MPYIDKETLQYPVTEADIRVAYPNVSFPVPFVAPSRYAIVFDAPQPAYNALTQSVREIAPVLTSKGHYERQWEVIDLDPEQAEANKAAALLAKRTAMVCTPWKIRKAMNTSGIRTEVEAAIAIADQDAKDAYEFAQEFKRLDPLVINLGRVLNKSEEELDKLFELAMSL